LIPKSDHRNERICNNFANRQLRFYQRESFGHGAETIALTTGGLTG